MRDNFLSKKYYTSDKIVDAIDNKDKNLEIELRRKRYKRYLFNFINKFLF